MKKFKLIRSHPGSAAYNMALDEKIFSSFLEDNIPVFRVYRWRAPSFTYGISQSPEDALNLDLCLKNNVEIAKRMTGGGVLFHHDEITYSFVCSKDDIGESKEILVSYRNICKFLINFYQSLGLKASFACLEDDFVSKSSPNKLCSASHEKYDIVINGRKIGGNAQKRRRQVIFQHGSIPLRVDWEMVRRYAINLPKNISQSVTTLSDELKPLPDKEQLQEKLIKSFKNTFEIEFMNEKEICHETSLVK